MMTYKCEVVTQDEEIVVHDEVMGHVVGNGAIKLQVNDGTEFIYNNFVKFKTCPTDEEKEQFKQMIVDKEAEAMATIQAQEKAALPLTKEEMNFPNSH